jgi:hypothetical protein
MDLYDFNNYVLCISFCACKHYLLSKLLKNWEYKPIALAEALIKYVELYKSEEILKMPGINPIRYNAPAIVVFFLFGFILFFA